MPNVHSRPLGVPVCVLAAVLVSVSAARSTDPASPPRKVDEAAEKKLRGLGAEADRLLEKGKFVEALAPATEAAGLAPKVYGEKDWRAFDAARRLKLAETGKNLLDDQRKQLTEAMRAEAEAKGLEASKPKDALKLALAATEGYAAALGEKTPEQARAWHLVGRLRLATGDPQGAKEANSKALEIRSEVLPKDHSDIGRSLNNLGLAHEGLKEWKESAEAIREAVKVWKADPRPASSLLALGLSNLARVQTSGRDHPGAKGTTKEWLELVRKANPPAPFLVADVLTYLGNTEYELREFADAKKNYAEALEIRRKANPPEPLLVADSLSYLGDTQHAMREYADAKKSYAEGLEIRRKINPPAPLLVADSLTRLGISQNAMREYAEAKKNLTEALEIRRKANPPQPLLVADSLSYLGFVQVDLREYEEAKKNHTEALKIFRGANPPEPVRTANTLVRLGFAQSALRDYPGAKKSHAEALKIRRRANPPDDLLVAQSLTYLGKAQRKLREYADARKSCEEAVKLFKSLRPANGTDLAEGLSSLGRVLTDVREHKKAKQAYEETLKLRKKVVPVNNLDIASSLQDIGDASYSSREYAKAEECYKKALDIRRGARPSDPSSTADSLDGLGDAACMLRKYLKAKETYEEGLKLRRETLKSDDPSAVTKTLYRLGEARRGLREYKEAKGDQVKALALVRGIVPADPLAVTEVLIALGNTEYDLREYTDAKKTYAEALEIRRKTDPPAPLLVADSLTYLGNTQNALQEYADAKKSHTEALKILRKADPPEPLRTASSLTGLGYAQFGLLEYVDAKKSHTEALEILRKAAPPDPLLVAQSLTYLGINQQKLREYADARKSYAEALEIRRKADPPMPLFVAKALSYLGNFQRSRGEYVEAKASHEEALGIRRNANPPDPLAVAQSLANLGFLYDDLKDYTRAKASHEEALGIRRNANPPDPLAVADSLTQLATAQVSLMEDEDGEKSFLEAAADRRKVVPLDSNAISYDLIMIGIIRMRLKQYDKAFEVFNEAYRTARSDESVNARVLGVSLMGMGTVDMRLGRSKDAKARFVNAIRYLREEAVRLAAVEAEAEQLATADKLRISLDLLLSAVCDQADVYSEVIRFKGAVTARQRFLRLVRDTTNAAVRRDLDAVVEVSRELVAAAYGAKSGEGEGNKYSPAMIQALQARRVELEETLTEKSAGYQQFIKTGGAKSDAVLLAIARAPDPTALIDFLEYRHTSAAEVGAPTVVERRVVAFVVEPGGNLVRAVPLGSADRIDKLVAAWRKRYVERKPLDAKEADPGAELRKLVWEPVEKELGKPKVVLVSPDGPFNFLPLAALPGKKKDTFLVHEYAFATVPTPALLPDIVARKLARPEAPSFLLVGDVNFGPPAAPVPPGKLPAIPRNWPQLAWTVSEVNDLRDEFEQAFPTAQRPDVVRKDRATKAAFTRAIPGRSYVHLATHGFFADEAEVSALDTLAAPAPIRLDRAVSGRNPGVLSGVVFAGINNPPGGAVEGCLLTALEAAELDLRVCELVTLSACDTGRGQTAGGEGVLGLQRAFGVAGARAVLASQWKVREAPTHALMREFYQRLWSNKNLGKAEALRQAQQWMIEHPDDIRSATEAKDNPGPLPPYLWAAFTIAGDWR